MLFEEETLTILSNSEVFLLTSYKGWLDHILSMFS